MYSRFSASLHLRVHVLLSPWTIQSTPPAPVGFFSQRKYQYRSPEAGMPQLCYRNDSHSRGLELLCAGAGEGGTKVKCSGRDSKVRRVLRPACK